MNEMKFNKNFIVTLHNDLIQARFTDTLSSVEQKILYTVLSNVEPPKEKIINGERVLEKVEEISNFKVPIKEFTEFLGIKDPNYSYFKANIKQLMKKVIEIEQPDGSWKLFQWVTYADYIKSEGTIEIEIAPRLYPYLINLENNFTKTRLEVILSFNSLYSSRLYQLLKKWSKLTKWTVELDELKHLIGVPTTIDKNGAKVFKLTRYNHFKTRALEKALNEINKYSELEVTFDENKKGRKITAITFYIKNKKTNKKIKEVETPKKEKSQEKKYYGEDFIKNYTWDSGNKTFIDKNNQSVKFDGRERAKAILIYNNMENMNTTSLYKIEQLLVDIMEFKNYDLVSEVNALFTYTKNESSIKSNEAFIISKLNII